ncbi:MAG: type II secretion system F family protein, partial [Longimicrobiales bacterium]
HLDTSAVNQAGRMTGADLALGLRMLATLLESGLPIARALAALDDVAPSSWHSALHAVQEGIRQGKSLAAALQASSLAVPPLVIGILQAGEAGSGVPRAVRRAAELMESTAAVRSTIRSALTYPLILFVAGTASLGLLVGVVLPRFQTILADLGQALPASTRLILMLAGVTKSGTLPSFLALGVLWLLWRMLSSSESGLIRWHELLLRLPVVGPVRLAAATARTTAALAALLDSGVALASAITHASRTAGDAAVSKRILAARDRIVAGASIATAVEEQVAMPRTAVRLIRTGEETGRLAAMLNHAASLEAARVSQMTRAAVSLLEPVLILVFSVIVAVVAAALLQAVYSIRPI